MKLVVATRNAGKWREIQTILEAPGLEILSLRDFPNAPEVVEDGATYLENARKKARAVAEHCGIWTLADDSGLEVDALGGRPGVHSARYAGEGASDAENLQKLLRKMAAVEPSGRGAGFRCVLVLRHPDGREFSTEGELRGDLADAPQGTGGFGYDPIFRPTGFDQTLAELSAEEKNRISHRRRALEKLKALLRSIREDGAALSTQG